MDHKRREPLPLDGEIALERFVALSPGIGLGEPRPKAAREAPKAKRGPLAAATPDKVPAAQAPKSEVAAPVFVGAAAFPPDQPVAAARPAPRRLTAARRLLAYSFDFILVCATLATGLLCAAVWQAAETGLDPTSDWYALAPVQWLAGFEVLQIVVGVYAVFLAYAILFKSVVGSTLGESLLRLGRKPPKNRARAARGG